MGHSQPVSSEAHSLKRKGELCMSRVCREGTPDDSEAEDRAGAPV